MRLQNSLQWIDKNRALVAAAGWKEGERKGRDGDKYLKKEENKRVRRDLDRRVVAEQGDSRGSRELQVRRI